MISSPGPPLPRQAEGVPCPFPPPPWLSLLSRYLYYLPSPTLVIQPLRAESARAVTGRQCQLNFFTKTAVTPERKVEKLFPRWEMNGHSEGYKRAVDQNWGRMANF